MKLRLLLLTIAFAILFMGCVPKQQTLPQDTTPQFSNSESKAEDNPVENIAKELFSGVWESEQLNINGFDVKIFLNIDNSEAEQKIYYNFNSSTYYYPAVYAENRDNGIYFCHNDEDHRAEYVLELTNADLIKCNFSINNCFEMTDTFEKDIEFTRLSDEFDIEHINSSIVSLSSLSRFDILKEYADYGKDRFNVNFEYKFDERENMLDIIEANKLDELVEGKNDAETAIALMNWLCDKYKHGNPPGGLASVRTPQALMTFAEQNGGTTNCRGLSLILAQLIRAYNIKAFHTTCMPYEEPFDDCHVVVSVYSESLNKWIMLDPTYNLYLKNNSGEIIGLEEFRTILIENGKLFANDEAGYHGQQFYPSDYRKYMTKNLVRLQRGTVERYGSDESDGRVILIPEKYMQNEAKKFSENFQKYFMTSEDDFWSE